MTVPAARRLEGKVAVVTGGASGMGLGTVRRFLAEGAAVVVADLNAATGLADVAESATRPFLFPDGPPHSSSDGSPDDPPGGTTAERTPRPVERRLRLRGVTRHNLVDLDAEIPLGVLTAVTGVSGSGKSTLVSQVLAETVGRHVHGGAAPAEAEDDAAPAAGARVAAVEGLEHGDLGIYDPWYGGPEDFESTWGMIDAAVPGVVRAVARELGADRASAQDAGRA